MRTLIRRFVLVVLVSLICAGCAALMNPTPDLVRTWNDAIVAAPGSDRLWRGKDLLGPNSPIARGSGNPLPVVLYLHGCTGLGELEIEFGQSLASQGYLFIAPDSFARRYRPLQCDPDRQTGGFNLFVFDFRMAEISYALEQLGQMPAVDPEHMFLMGGSEGGVAAALYRGDQYSGRIIFQWTCTGSPLVRGIAAPPDEPVLAIVNQGDPWYDDQHTTGQAGDCGPYLSNRPHSKSLILRRPGIHDVLSAPNVRVAIFDFLAQLNQ